MKYEVMLWYPTIDCNYIRTINNVSYINNNENDYEFKDENAKTLFSAPRERVVFIERVDD